MTTSRPPMIGLMGILPGFQRSVSKKIEPLMPLKKRHLVLKKQSVMPCPFLWLLKRSLPGFHFLCKRNTKNHIGFCTPAQRIYSIWKDFSYKRQAAERIQFPDKPMPFKFNSQIVEIQDGKEFRRRREEKIETVCVSNPCGTKPLATSIPNEYGRSVFAQMHESYLLVSARSDDLRIGIHESSPSECAPL